MLNPASQNLFYLWSLFGLFLPIATVENFIRCIVVGGWGEILISNVLFNLVLGAELSISILTYWALVDWIINSMGI